MKRLLMVGGGGHCRSVLDSVLTLNMYDEIGIIDHNKISIFGVPVIGNDDDLLKLYQRGWTEAFVTVGSIGNTNIRQKIYQTCLEIGFSISTIIDSTAVIARGVSIGQGSFVGKNAVINSSSVVGESVIINTGVVVEHDCSIGSFSHISPGTILCGQVQVGENSHIGAGTVVRQQISIGKNVLVGLGSVVVKDIPDNVIAFGSPCKVVI